MHVGYLDADREPVRPPPGGGVDNITTLGGNDIVIGGRFGDTVDAGDGDNLVIGDSGRITAASAGVRNSAVCR